MVDGKPVKIISEEVDSTGESKVKVTTKRLVKRRWQNSVNYVDRQDQNRSLLMDAYMTVPAKYLRFEGCEPGSQDDAECLKYRAQYLKEYAVVDEPTHFSVGDGGRDPIIRLNLYRRYGGTHVVSVSSLKEADEAIRFLEKRDGKWVDISGTVVPKFDPENNYEPGRYDTTIEVRGKKTNAEQESEYGPRLYALVWKDGKFEVEK